MKLNKTILAASLALVTITGANAAVDMNLTGATSISKSIHQGIMNAMTDMTYAYDATGGATILTTKKAIFKGTVNGVTGVTIRTSFTGSVNGIQDLAGNTRLSYIDKTVTCTTTGNTSGITTTTNVAGNEPNVAFSDVFQATTNYTTPKLTDAPIAVVPFVFWANASAPAEMDNITPQLFKAIQTLPQPISMFTGNLEDTRFVYPIGRDGGSGTRMTVLAETAWGAKVPVNQYNATVSSGTCSSLMLTPQVGTVGTAGYIAEGNNGVSAGNLVTALNATSATTDAGDVVLIGYLGLADGANVTSGKALKYNGVAYSADAVKSGQYTLWCYEHMFTRQGYATSGAEQTVLQKVKSEIVKPAALNLSQGIDEADMMVSRTTDGDLVGTK